MGESKTYAFKPTDVRLAKIAKALSHPSRIAIIKLLLKKNTCVCGDIVLAIPLSQSTVSQHLKALKAAGLVKGKISGSNTCYCVHAENWAFASKSFSNFLDKAQCKNPTCC
ncbi:MAG: ArsR/SmtB family transcription factor [Bacteroidota bacterium]|jgi:ArsR family transcriptional regulator